MFGILWTAWTFIFPEITGFQQSRGIEYTWLLEAVPLSSSSHLCVCHKWYNTVTGDPHGWCIIAREDSFHPVKLGLGVCIYKVSLRCTDFNGLVLHGVVFSEQQQKQICEDGDSLVMVAQVTSPLSLIWSLLIVFRLALVLLPPNGFELTGFVRKHTVLCIRW